jgi:hypothetical protein
VRPNGPLDTVGRPLLSNGGRPFFAVPGRGARLRRVGMAAVLLPCVGLSAADAAAQVPQPASQLTEQGVRPFQPGVGIDWTRRAVHVDGQVVLREGPIEFLACLPGKEHESIICFDASAVHIYMALGLVGLEPGHPPRWQEPHGRFGPPAGDLVDVTVEWEEGERRRHAAGFDWLRELEFARVPIDRPWVFAGSQRLPDGTLSADRGGDGFAVVDKPGCLLALSRGHVNHDAELWVAANTAAIPPLRTSVRVVLRPAEPRVYEVRVDFRGAVFVDDRYASWEDLADLIGLARRLSGDHVQLIRLDGTLQSDAARLREALMAAGVPAGALRFVRCDSGSATHGDTDR